MECVISIVIPVYNTPIDMFKKCINSLISQTRLDFEVILVDDGSTSGVEKECERYSNLFSNITVIHKANGGLAAARNTGVRNSKGKWIMFLDSDDWIESKTCEELFKCIRRNEKVDVITFGYVHDYGNRIKNCVFDFKDNEIFCDNDKEKLFLKALELPSLFSSSCWKLFNKKFLEEKNLFHDESIRQGSEDLEFMLRVINDLKKMICLNKRFYHYMMNVNSITNSFNEKNAYLVLDCFKKMEIIIIQQEQSIIDAFYTRAWYAVCSSLISGFMNPNNTLKYSEKKTKVKKYVDSNYCQRIIKNLKVSNLSISRRITLICTKQNLWFIIYIISILRGKQKNR